MVFDKEKDEYDYLNVRKWLKEVIYKKTIFRTSYFQELLKKAKAKYKSVAYALYRALKALKQKFPLSLVKFHRKQLVFLGEIFVKKRDIVLFKGGNKSGKTTALVSACVLKALEKPNAKVWVVVVSFPLGEDVVSSRIETLSKGFATFNKKTYTYEFFNGSKITLKSVESGVYSFQSASVDLVAFDERPPKEIFLEAYARTIDTQGQVIMTYTPTEGVDWVYDMFFAKDKGIPDEDFSIVNVATIQNKFIKHDKIQKIRNISEEEYMKRVYGAYVLANDVLLLKNEDLTELLQTSFTRYSLVLDQNKDVVEIPEQQDINTLEYFKYPTTNKSYFVGVDISGGVELDTSVILVYTLSGEVCCQYYSNKDSVREVAYKAVYLARKYNNALISFERNGIGFAFSDYLKELGYFNIIRDKSNNLGIAITRDERLYLYKILLEYLNTKQIQITSNIAKELNKLRVDTGYIRASGGDDFVSALLLVIKSIHSQKIQFSVLSGSVEKKANDIINYSLA
ncbi:MAG: phage terminase large subunit [Brevinematia bacterium]